MNEIEKLYFTTGEMAKEVNVAPSCIRTWCDYFGIEPMRYRRGYRKFEREHLPVFREIKRLLYEEGYTVRGAKRKLNKPQ